VALLTFHLVAEGVVVVLEALLFTMAVLVALAVEVLQAALLVGLLVQIHLQAELETTAEAVVAVPLLSEAL
jgi:hypothetical protein